MSRNKLFFARLIILTLVILATGLIISRYQLFKLPSAFIPMVGFYFIISMLSFFINLRGTTKEGEIAVWYYLSSVMVKFLLAAASIFILTRLYTEERTNIVWVSFVLYPLYEAVVTIDIYKRIR